MRAWVRVIDREQSIRVIDKEEPSRTEHLTCLNVVVGGGRGVGGPAVGPGHSAWHRSPDAAALGPEWVPGQQYVEQETKRLRSCGKIITCFTLT